MTPPAAMIQLTLTGNPMGVIDVDAGSTTNRPFHDNGGVHTYREIIANWGANYNGEANTHGGNQSAWGNQSSWGASGGMEDRGNKANGDVMPEG